MNLINKEQPLQELQSHNQNLLIVYGLEGSGRKTLLQHFAKLQHRLYVPIENKIDNIREINDLAYQTTEPLLICIENGDDLTIQAQNALLKLSEEPPVNVRVAVVVENLNTLLPTTLSRGVTVQMSFITKEHIGEYLENKPNFAELKPEEVKAIMDIAATFGDVDDLLQVDISEFIKFCDKIIFNIDSVSEVNAFKITKSLKLKDEDLGYKPLLLLNSINHLLPKKNLTNRVLKVFNTANNQCIKYLKKGVSPLMAIDNWILDLRKGLSQ